MANLFLSPHKIITGKNALESAGALVKKLGSKALIVTDKVMVSTGNVTKLTKILSDNDIKYEVLDAINSEPTDEMVYQGVKMYGQTNCEFLIAIGGGSPIDAMKAIGAMTTNSGSLSSYMGKELENLPPNLVAIPTTAGTGSEATQFTIIADTKNNVKMLLKGTGLIPVLAVVDPALSVSAPAKVTAATGIDALTHAIEAYTSRKAQPLADTFAISACKRIFANLRKAYLDGGDFEARKEMSIASLEAGIAFNNSSVTIIHGMSRPIGALFHVPHGTSNAMLMGECLNFAAAGAAGRFADIAKAVGFYQEGMSDYEAAKELVKESIRLCKDLQIPSLEEFGIDRKEFYDNIDKMACDALESGSPGNTGRDVSKDDIVEIYKRLWE
ncbi:MAG: alcohol dehydrogenase [Firmicutes bacterium]|nr:alcohol dehydrogenase [Bacillota bacterium]